MTHFQLILLPSPQTTGPSQATLNLGWLAEEHVRSIPPLQVLQSVLLGVHLLADKGQPTGRREGREDMTGSCPWEHERLPCGVDTHYIRLYLLSANRFIKCFFLVVVVALSQTNILQKLLLVPLQNSGFDFILHKLSVFQQQEKCLE